MMTVVSGCFGVWSQVSFANVVQYGTALVLFMKSSRLGCCLMNFESDILVKQKIVFLPLITVPLDSVS